MSNLNIDLDKKIIEFVEKKTGENIEEKVKLIVYFALKEQNILFDDIYISIYSTSKEEIRKINKTYRNVDRETDVLSFPIFDKAEYENLKFKEIELGDIIMCLDVVEKHSVEYGTGIKREVLYMITHGVAHLLGYDHIKEDEKREMRIFEENILNKVGVMKLDE